MARSSSHMGSSFLPGSFNLKRAEALAFFFVQFVEEYRIHPAPARSPAQRLLQLLQRLRVARRQHLYVTVFGVAHPPAQLQGGRLAVHEPPEPNTLHTPLDPGVTHH